MVDSRVKSNSTQVFSRNPIPELPEIHQIVLPTPWAVGSVQIYLIDRDPLTLIDTGVNTSRSFAALELALDRLGHGIDEIERVILTHYHEDHMGQAEAIRRAAPNLEVWAHSAEVESIENWTPSRHENIDGLAELLMEYGVPEQTLAILATQARSRLAKTPLSEATRVDRALHSGDPVDFKDFELQVIHSPGHTPGHILLLEPVHGVAFTGDHIMGSAVPYTENYIVPGLPDPADPAARAPRFKGLLAYLGSLRAQRQMPLSTLLPAHGGVLRPPSRYLMDARLFYDVRVQRLERGLRNLEAMGQEVTGWQLSQALYPQAGSGADLKTRMLTVIGALDVLEAAGKCKTRRRSDGLLVHARSSGA
jgi:glyoxylase-like metal-dependent hydrolase (beta-lactamase superfamily II)